MVVGVDVRDGMFGVIRQRHALPYGYCRKMTDVLRKADEIRSVVFKVDHLEILPYCERLPNPPNYRQSGGIS